MTDDKAVALINEWLNLAKEVGDMNLNRMEYDEERYNYAMDRMDVIRKEINDYHEQMMMDRDCNQCKYCGVPKIEKPCQDCNNNHFYQFLGLERDEDCFEKANA